MWKVSCENWLWEASYFSTAFPHGSPQVFHNLEGVFHGEAWSEISLCALNRRSRRGKDPVERGENATIVAELNALLLILKEEYLEKCVSLSHQVKSLIMKHLLLSLFLFLSLGVSARELHLLPEPQQVQLTGGVPFRLTARTHIVYSPSLEPQARYLAEVLRPSTGYALKIHRKERTQHGITLRLDPMIEQAEGYKLTVTKEKVVIAARDAAGAFYGIQTFLQLLPPQVLSSRLQWGVKWEVPAVKIQDAPARPWRGMMLDVARYYYDIPFLKRYIDLMAHHKLNKLQLHLIDDSGWRLEIKQYPLLTEVGAWAGPVERRLGGFYTQDEMQDLIDYAAVRGVEIIPEIEFPAHILSAIVAYPWLSCTEKQHEVPMQHFISRDLLCVGKESSFDFLKAVLDEVVALFPSPIINIGGDEAVYDRWEACPHCQELMKKEGIAKASDLQGWLTNRVATALAPKGRTCMGWEEIIMRGKVEQPVIALLWHNAADSIAALKTGHKAVLTPASHLYFDFPEDDTPGEVQAATWLPPVSLEKVYSLQFNDYSPTSTVLGVQGCLWSDQFIHGTRLQEIEPLNEDRSERYAEYLSFPRVVALSEIAWLPMAHRSWPRFSRSMAHHYHRLDALDVNYRLPKPQLQKQGKTVSLSPALAGSQVVYTTDGTHPTRHSTRYTKPLVVDSLPLFHAATLWKGRTSLPTYFKPDLSQFAHLGQLAAQLRHENNSTNAVTFQQEVTGKLPSNGAYTLSIVQTLGLTDARYQKVEVFKRNELVASCLTPTYDKATRTTTFRFTLNNHEAGTPFHLRITYVPPVGKIEEMMFLKKD